MRGFEVSPLTDDGDTARFAAVAPADAFFFDGHFPDDAVLPAVAQLAALAEPLARRRWPALGALARASRLKFLRVVRPGEALTLRLSRAGLRVAFTLHAGPEAVSQGVLDFTEATDP
jgi:3-hydroxymyristoyl/3-hydroxydecanoyl-(acyl carrier protein) dehydratase